jgi:hypothetical protein
MRPCLRCHIGFDDDDDIERLGKLLVQDLGLIETCFDPVFHTSLAEELLGNGVDIQFVAIFPARTSPLVRTVIRKLQGRVRAQLRNQLQATPAHHLEGRAVAKMAIQGQVHQGNAAGNQLELGLEYGLNAL